MKDILEFEIDGEPVYVEVEKSDHEGAQRVARGDSEAEKEKNRFVDAVSHIRPAAEALLKSLQEMDSPDEVRLDFGIKFNAKVGAVFASVNSEATFKVSLGWNSTKKQTTDSK